MRKISLLWLWVAAIAASATLYAQPKDTTSKAGTITLEEIWQTYKYAPKYSDGFTWMSNDKYYTLVKDGAIWRYNIETDKPEEALVRLTMLPYPEGVTYKDVQDYAFDSSEARVLIKAKTEQIYRHSSKEVCMVYGRKLGKLHVLNEGKPVSLATFSPKGDKIAYIFENNLYYATLYDTTENTVVQVTQDGMITQVINGMTDWVYEEEFGFTKAFAWSPDGKYLAFYRSDESNVPEFSMPIYQGLYPDLYTFKYPKAGEPNSEVSIITYDMTTGNSRRVIDGTGKDQYIPLMVWSNKANELAVIRMNRLQNELELLGIDAITGNITTILTEKNKTYIEMEQTKLYFIPGSEDFLWTSEQSGYNHIYRYGRDGKVKDEITKGNYDVTEIVGVDGKNEKIYFMSTEVSPTERRLYVVGFKGNGKKRLTDEAGVHKVTMSSGFNRFVDTYSTMSMPPKTALYTSGGGLIKVLEANSKLVEYLSKLDIIQPEFFTVDVNYEKAKLNGWMIKPFGFDPKKTYPVLMYVYGGPGHQTVMNEFGSFNYMWFQCLAQHGYIVVSIDGHGTGGRGEVFKKATYGQLGKLECLDQLSAARYLQTLPYVNPNRIGIWGWSFGGYLTSLCMTKGDGIFKAGIAVAPVTNWRFYDTIYTERYLKRPQDNAAGYDDNSPINFAKNLKGRYLLVHGSADDNVHVQNSMEWTTALIQANKQFDQFIYPDKNHGIYGGNTRYHLYRKMTDFLLQNL